MLMGIKSTYSLTLLAIFIVIFILSCSNLTKHKYLYVFIVTILLSTLGYFFDPISAYKKGNYTDLVRFFKTIEAINGANFNNKIIIFQEYNNIPVMKLLLFAISKIGIKQLLPFISSFIFYGSFGLCVVKISEKYNVSNKLMGLAFFSFICLFNFKMVISNIRCPLGDAIFMFTLYYDFFTSSKKIWCIIGYLICCAIHPLFIIFTLLRLIFKFLNRFTIKLFYIFTLIYSFFINYIFELIGKFTKLELFTYLSTKLDYYISVGNTRYNEPLLLLTGVIQIIVLIYFLLIAKKHIIKSSKEDLFYHFTMAFVILTVGSSWNFVTFQRCTWLLIFFIVYWLIFLKSIKNQNIKFKITIYDIIMVSLIAFSLISYFFTYQYNVLTF